MPDGMYNHLIKVDFKVNNAEGAKTEVTSTVDSINRAFDSLGKKATMPRQLESQLSAISGAMKELGFSEQQVAGVFNEFKSAGPAVKFTAEGLNTLKSALQKTGATQPQINSLMKSLSTKVNVPTNKINDFQRALARAAIVAPVWMALRSAMMSVISLIKNQISFILEMEDAMARIQIVGKGTAEEYDNLKYSLLGLSLAYGVSASEAMKAAKVFAQQGKTVAETFTLTRAAMIGAQVLGKDVATVVEDLTAAMNAFNIPAQNATSIIDNLINVERQFAVTSADLSSGIKVTGATANQMGVTLAELAGDITAVIEVTRKSGSETARGLQFIYARLLTSGKPIIEQLTGIKFYLDEQGKSTSALTGTLRSATDVLDELASKWGNLTNEEKLNIAVATGSKRQITVMMALMQNYNHAIDARIAALTSAGEAEKALGILQDTVTYKTKQLGSAWNALTATIVDTGAWKGLLDNMAYSITFFAKLTNAVKGYRIEIAKEVGDELAVIETQQNQISSISELIKIRNKLLSAPTSDENTKRIEKLNEAITTITEGNPTVKLALESGNPEELRKAVDSISDMLLRKKIVTQVKVDFLPDLQALSDKRADLQRALEDIAPIARNLMGKKIAKDIQDVDKQSLEIQKKQTAEIQKQFKLAKDKGLAQEMIDEDERVRLAGELTAAEKEDLEIQKQLSNYRYLSNATTEQQIQKEIELIKNATMLYDVHERNIKLSQLENKLLDERLQKKEDERKKMLSLAKQYEEGDASERARITRVTELSKMAPETLARQYEDDLYDKGIITDYWSTFSQEAQRAIEDTIIKMSDLPSLKSDYDLQLESLDRLSQIGKTTGETKSLANIANYGAKEININVEAGGMPTAEEIVRIINEETFKALLADDEFQRMFAKKLIDKLPGGK